jgi:hypothetical protein
VAPKKTASAVDDDHTPKAGPFRVRRFLADHFKNRPWSLTELTGFWETYARLGLPNEDFVAEFTNGKPASLAQRTWELLLAQHLHDQGHALTCVGNGPDLCFEHGGQRIWVEAVCPEPKGFPTGWLDNPMEACERSPTAPPPFLPVLAASPPSFPLRLQPQLCKIFARPAPPEDSVRARFSPRHEEWFKRVLVRLAFQGL